MNNIENDPFELNTSIWNTPPGPVNNNQSPNQGTKTSSAGYSGTAVSAATSKYSSLLGSRASFSEPGPANELLGNYTLWARDSFPAYNTPSASFAPSAPSAASSASAAAAGQNFPQTSSQNPAQNSAQQQLAQGWGGGLVMGTRRHSYTPSLKLEPVFQEAAANNNASSTSASFSGESSNTSASAASSNAAASLLESTPPLIAAYQNMDFYFTNDVHGRVTIRDYSVSNLSSGLEDLIKTGVQLPRFSNSSASLSSTKLVLVAFKAGRVDVFFLPDSSNLKLKLADLVFVEADRGCDLGKVVRLDVSIDEARMLKYLQHQEQQAALASFEHASGSSPPNSSNSNNSSSNMPTLHFPKPILRLALPNEVSQVLNKQSDEEKAKKICSLKVDTSNLSMAVIDAEYQWDRRKLTFYYNASHRIDFRDLVRELFRIYKTRIWMCAVSSSITSKEGYDIVSPNLNWSSPPQIHTNPNLDTSITSGSRDGSISTGVESSIRNQGLPQDQDLSQFIPRQFSSPNSSW